ncbi:hypothetical protein PHET_01888 [Paragonimus heterotremus]|uniref:Uncharacterized protein n=1 Tax=Paragonimus heterotremus TaxID=100268 RepID=A0A8J4T2U8_9TREM|nr:hypothetical protein PHET_01888 [Paragonimus heterotremus]
MGYTQPCLISACSNNNNAHSPSQQSPYSQMTKVYTETNTKDGGDARTIPQKYSQGNRDDPTCNSNINGCENSPKRSLFLQRTNRLSLNKVSHTSCLPNTGGSKGSCNKRTGKEPISRKEVVINDKPIIRLSRRKSTETGTSAERQSNGYRIFANGEKHSAGYADPSCGIISTSNTGLFRNDENKSKKCVKRLSSKKRSKPTTIHLYQSYRDPNILQWLERKEKEKRREQQRQKFEERTKYVTQKSVHVGQKKRAELAKFAFDTRLDSKSRQTGARKASSANVEGVSKKTKSAIITKADKQEAPNLKGLFQPFSNDSDTQQDTDNIKSTASAGKLQGIPLATCNHEEILKKSSGENEVECQEIVFRSESHDARFVLGEVSQPTACEMNQTTFTDYQSADENTVQPFDVFESTEVSTVVENCHHELQGLQELQDLTATKLTHKQWLRQNFLQARYSEQARWETEEHVALAEKARPTFLQSWK